MFTINNQKDLVEGLKKTAIKICAYISNKPFGEHYCDCKYGIGANSYEEVRTKYLGEQSGCPEVSQAAVLINELTDREWNNLLKRYHRKQARAYREAARARKNREKLGA